VLQLTAAAIAGNLAIWRDALARRPHYLYNPPSPMALFYLFHLNNYEIARDSSRDKDSKTLYPADTLAGMAKPGDLHGSLLASLQRRLPQFLPCHVLSTPSALKRKGPSGPSPFNKDPRHEFRRELVS
jgi:hypothetical protein